MSQQNENAISRRRFLQSATATFGVLMLTSHKILRSVAASINSVYGSGLYGQGLYGGVATAAAPTLSLSSSGILTWSDDNIDCTYNLYHSTTPYTGYTLLADGLTEQSFAVGNLQGNRFYMVGVICSGGATAVSNEVSKFDFPLVSESS